MTTAGTPQPGDGLRFPEVFPGQQQRLFGQGHLADQIGIRHAILAPFVNHCDKDNTYMARTMVFLPFWPFFDLICLCALARCARWCYDGFTATQKGERSCCTLRSWKTTPGTSGNSLPLWSATRARTANRSAPASSAMATRSSKATPPTTTSSCSTYRCAAWTACAPRSASASWIRT